MNRIFLMVILAGIALVRPALSVEPAPGKSPVEKKEFLDGLVAANALFVQGKIQEAAMAYQALLKEDITPPTWGKVTFNLGVAQMRLSRFDDAILTFETVFPSKVDDKETGGNIMEEFRNYRFRASLLIAQCHEAKGDIPKALQVIEKTRDQNLFQAHCGNCATDAAKMLQDRIEELQSKLKP